MIFKKQFSIVLTFILLISNLGLAFNVHYCADKIESITLYAPPSSEVTVDECCGIVEVDSDCCNDKVIKAEIKSDQIIVKTFSFDNHFIEVAYYWKPQLFNFTKIYKQKDIISYYCEAHAPPLYLLYSQYTFYA